MTKARHWYMEYVVKDWIVDTDPLLELTRAFWHEALCRMWLSDRCGQLVGSYSEIAKLCRSTTNNARAAIADLQKWSVADIEINGESVTITNRRMRRDFLDRESNRKRVNKHRHSNGDCNAGVTDSKSIEEHKIGETIRGCNGVSNAPVTPHTNSNPNNHPNKEGTSPLPESLQTDEFRAAWDDWQRHRREKRKPLTFTGIERQMRDFNKFGEKAAIAAIDEAIKNGWTGVFPERHTATAASQIRSATRTEDRTRKLLQEQK